VHVTDETIGYCDGAPEPATPGLTDLLIRAFDLVAAAAALFFSLPLFAAVALAVRIFDPGPVLYAHTRIGRGGREFACLKFRSMAVDSEARLQAYLATSASARQEWSRYHKLALDPRVTPLGRFLRTSSLDELPQLLNVLKGEMSLVGPRPIVRAEVRRYGRHFKTYCSVRPGITGLWQVLGRNRVSYRRRVAMDLLYCRRRSFGFNLQILFATIPAVLLKRGAH
jgi:lipopolysaccharide/colanic/teichoic acid biosynthesis glycosyltransferase